MNSQTVKVFKQSLEAVGNGLKKLSEEAENNTFISLFKALAQVRHDTIIIINRSAKAEGLQSGPIPPVPILGSEGDLYLETTNYVLYIKKNGLWELA